MESRRIIRVMDFRTAKIFYTNQDFKELTVLLVKSNWRMDGKTAHDYKVP
jgi:hypothetical protein